MSPLRISIEQLYRTNYDQYVGQAGAFLGDFKGHAQDAVQDAMVNALTYEATFKGDPDSLAEVGGWIKVLLHNAAVKIVNAERRQGCATGDEDTKEEMTDDLLAVMIHNERAESVKWEMQQKAKPWGEVLHGYFIEGFTGKELEEKYGKTQANIRKVAQRFKDDMVVAYG